MKLKDNLRELFHLLWVECSEQVVTYARNFASVGNVAYVDFEQVNKSVTLSLFVRVLVPKSL